METESDLKNKIHYFAREKYFQTMEDLALDGLKTYPGDLSFKLYNNFALVLCRRYQEGIRELESLINVENLNIGALLALITAHKASNSFDKETLSQLDAKLKTERKITSEYGLYYGALFLFLNGKMEKAKEYLDRHLKHNPSNPEGMTLKGWLEITADNATSHKTAAQCFNTVLNKEKRNMDAHLGLIKLKEIEKDYDGAIAILNQLIVKYPNSVPPLIEKMKVHLACSDWDLTTEVATRILSFDARCLEALRMKALVLLVRDGNYDEAAMSIKRILIEMEKSEGKNALLFLSNGQLFSYLSGKNPKILTETIRFVEKAAQLEPSNVEFITELGYHNLLQGKIKEATKFFKNAAKLDDSSVTALTGLMWCQVKERNINLQVKQQVEFLREIQNDQPTAELLLLSAKLANNSSEALELLDRATDIHFNIFKKFPYGIQYLFHLNPVFSMDLVQEYIKYMSRNLSYDPSKGPSASGPMNKCLKILEEIKKDCPGLLEAQYEYAHVQFLIGNIKEARETAMHILDDLDATSAETHILMARIHLQEKNYNLGAQSLEVGLSYNFKIREHPLYHLIQAMVQKENGNLTECINSLKLAMTTCGIRQASGQNKITPEYELSVADKATLYLELINAYQSNNQMQDASKIIDEAMELFRGTSEEGSILIANAEYLVNAGNVSQAIEMLEKIAPGEGHYALSKKTLANIYFVHKKDRESFIQCYKDIVHNDPCGDTYIMFGDALTSIQEPDLAIEAYEEALKYHPKDFRSMCKMGKALIKTHHFSKAINYYKEAVKNEKNLELIYDMAELYFKLGQLDNAERTLVAEVENSKALDSNDINIISCRTRLYQLLAKVRDKSGNLTESLAALKAAKDNHNRIEKRILTQSDEHKDIVSTICSDMALLMTRLRDFNSAIKCYKEALTLKPNDTKILVALCRLYMQVNDLDECQLMSKRLLNADPENEAAIVMLADLAFRKVDFESAGHHFKQLLSRRPTCWTALARLIEVMRRTGTLEDIGPYLEKCDSLPLQKTDLAGHSFCKGLFEWYSGKPTLAIRHFNRARRDAEWGQQAACNMIEICLNPDNEMLGGEAFSDELDEEEPQDSKEMALKTAQRLLAELTNSQTAEESLSLRLLQNFWLLATKQKHNIEKALQNFMTIASKDIYRDNVGVALGIATAYMLQKQVQKARNHLKRMVKNQWTYEDAEYLERCWLLLTDIYIQSGKMELPVELIQKILQHNKSCYKAYEYAGYIAEKEQLYKDAAIQYENAWKYEGYTNPAIGYKLAFNYLKGKRYADAIDVCNTILKLYPDYPRISKDILEKARNNLRT